MSIRRIIVAALLLVLATAAAYAAPGVAGMGGLRAGLASWYGQRFEGRTMANGCIFRQSRLTAASRSLPLGTMIRVRRLHSERSVDVEVTDRGPYVAGRFLDMSRAAAQALDMIAAGVVMVSIEPLGVRRSAGCRRVG